MITHEAQPKQHVGYRLPPAVVEAIRDAAEAKGLTQTQIVQDWLARMAKAEGFLDGAATR